MAAALEVAAVKVREKGVGMEWESSRDVGAVKITGPMYWDQSATGPTFLIPWRVLSEFRTFLYYFRDPNHTKRF